MYLESTYFLYRNLRIFSEKNYKKQVHIFNHLLLLVLITVEISCNLILRNHWTWT